MNNDAENGESGLWKISRFSEVSAPSNRKRCAGFGIRESRTENRDSGIGISPETRAPDPGPRAPISGLHDIISVLDRYGIRLSKDLGQHFLADERIIERQIRAAALTRRDVVLEIGPGIGTLTKRIAEKAKKVIAVEADARLCRVLPEIMSGYDNFELIKGDALKADFPKFDKIVSNLPYQISSDITFKFLEHNFEYAVLMYQKEFARRMAAKPCSKDYSRLSVSVYYKADCRVLFNVPKGAFYPPPKVDSSVVLLKPLKEPRFKVQSEKTFHKVTDLLFQHRRKMVRASLRMEWPSRLKDARLAKYLEKRPEVLTPEEIGEISDVLVS